MEQTIKKSVGLFTAIASAIAFFTSVMYLLTYWYTFGINPFEFIDISNIIAHSIIPLLLSSGIFLYMVFHYFIKGYFFIPYNECGDINPKIFKRIKKSGRLKIVLVILLIIMVVPCVLVYWFYFFWTYPPICIAFLVTGYLTIYKNFGKRFIPNQDIRFILLLIIVIFPLEGAACGKKYAVWHRAARNFK